MSSDAAAVDEDDVLLVESRGPISILTLQRPTRRNALSRQLIDQLVLELDRASNDTACAAIILTGSGEAFCAGLDLHELENDRSLLDRRLLDALERCSKPLIGAINGAAVTGGLEISLACDFLIASERATFRDTHALVGILPSWGLTVRLQAAVGRSWARRMSLTAQPVNADEALRMRLVTEVVAHGDLMPRAMAVAESVAATDPRTAAAMREVYAAVQGRDQQTGLALELAAHEAHAHPHDLASNRRHILGSPR